MKNFEFEKRTYQNFITQNLHHVKEYRISRKKKTVEIPKRRLYMNIFWLLLGGGPFFGWWWVVVDIFWLVVDDVGGCGLLGAVVRGNIV